MYWEKLTEKGFTLSERIWIRNEIIEDSGLRDSHPMIEKKGDSFRSKFSSISHYVFKTENEVVLANAIFINMEPGEDFISLVKHTFRMIGVKSDWI